MVLQLPRRAEIGFRIIIIKRPWRSNQVQNSRGEQRGRLTVAGRGGEAETDEMKALNRLSDPGGRQMRPQATRPAGSEGCPDPGDGEQQLWL